MSLDLLHWFRSVPENVPDATRRYYLYWKALYFICVLAHVYAIVAFGLSGVTFMFFFNMVSVPLFVFALWLLQRGRFRLAFWMVNAELTLHGVGATVCIGPVTGVHTFIAYSVVLMFIQPFYNLRTSCLFALVPAALLIGLMIYVWDQPPVYPLSPAWTMTYAAVSWSTFPISLAAMILPFIAEARRAEEKLAEAYEESEGLLLNILPRAIANRLKQTRGMIADDHDEVAVLFADIVGFTRVSDRLPPAEVVSMLNAVFNDCDRLADKYGVEKIKTIGDAYMVVAGVPDAQADPAAVLARMALEMMDVVSQHRFPGSDAPVRLRIGLNSGRVVAGVIGQRKFAYDLWGDTVNVAARMESTGEPGRIQVPGVVAEALAGRFDFAPRGEIEIKGKGVMPTSFLIGEQPGA